MRTIDIAAIVILSVVAANSAPRTRAQEAVKLTDDGALKIQFTDANGGNHTSTGPVLHKNQEGVIEIRFTQDKATANINLPR